MSNSGSGRRTKYTEENINLICDAIAVTGCEKTAYRKAGVGHNTFYRWKKTKQEFRDKVAQSHREYVRTTGDAIQRQAKKAFAAYLYGEVVESWQSTEEVKDASGKVISTKITTREVNRGVPKWAIDRVIPANDVLVAIQILVQNNMLPAEAIEQAHQGIEVLRSQIVSLMNQQLNPDLIDVEDEDND